MYQDFNRYKVLRVFFDHPSKKFQLRELERITGVSLPSVRNHVRLLEEEGFVNEVSTGVYKGYVLSDTEKVRSYKRNDLLLRLEDSGLVDEIERKCRPNCIILYGSAVEGRDDEMGDIDLFVQAEEKEMELSRYENELSRKISIIFEPELEKLTRELINSLANGITLKGFLKVL